MLRVALEVLQSRKKLVDEGKSQTMKSRHLANANGYSEAVDLYAWADGKSQWGFEYMRKVASAMFIASAELGVPIKWGGFMA